MDHRYAAAAHGVEHLPRVGRHETLVVARAESARPGVEELEHLGAGLDLGEQVSDDRVGQQVHEPREGGRLVEHELLHLGVLARMAALDHVAGERERGAGEADEWHPAAQLAGHEAQGVEHVGSVGPGIADAHAVEVGRAAHGALDHRAVAGVEVEADAHALEWQEDVGEDDGGVELEPGERLQRDLGGHVGPPAQLDEAQLLTQGAILGQVAAGLTHEPDRGGVDGLAQAGVEQSRRHVVTSVVSLAGVALCRAALF